jgi:hypothetical protein
VKGLQAQLRARGLPVSGTKDALIARLEGASRKRTALHYERA